jgi:hypothetical protein
MAPQINTQIATIEIQDNKVVNHTKAILTMRVVRSLLQHSAAEMKRGLVSTNTPVPPRR